jgi:hypothetical protein
VLATVEEFAMIRFDMTRDHAAVLAERVQESIDEHEEQYDDPGDELVTLGLAMTEQTYEIFANQIANLVELAEDVSGDETISAQVVLDPELTHDDPEGISVSVIINESQLHDIHQNSKKALAKSDGDLHRWQFSVSYNGAQMLVQQIVAAVKGAENPLDEVDLEGGDQ